MAFTASHSSFFSFLFLQVANNEDAKCTAFTVSVDLHVSKGISTGISASDRAATLRALADPATTARDLTRPGHIFPLRAVEGGVLKRNGHTEATVDLARMAGLAPAGVLCEIVTEDCSEMMRAPELKIFAEKHKLVMTSIHDMILYRKETGK
jgi:3,4-dihydroxy 2-butanone 4-phosphate synthase/GTP cyclohydrolase II